MESFFEEFLLSVIDRSLVLGRNGSFVRVREGGVLTYYIDNQM